jgi:hypothetical protein
MESLANIVNTINCVVRNTERHEWRDRLSAFGISYVGAGTRRVVFGWKDFVIKVTKEEQFPDNRNEVAAYELLANVAPEMADMLEPPTYITEDGIAMAMRRAENTVTDLTRSAEGDYAGTRLDRLDRLMWAMEDRWRRHNENHGGLLRYVENDFHNGNVAQMPDGRFKVIDYGFAQPYLDDWEHGANY